jgi:hypothetical protein
VAPSKTALLMCDLQDEEDEELLRRAKENRAERILQQQETTRTFMEQEGLANNKLNQDATPVQKAVFKVGGRKRKAGKGRSSCEDLQR